MLARGRDLMLEWLGLEPGQRVLDLGCGPVALTNRLAAAVGPTGQVTAIDLGPRRRELLRQGAPAHVHVLRMDIEHLELAEGGFDAATAALSLQFCPDLDRALAEVHRVLRPGGHLAASFPAEPFGRLGAAVFDGIRDLLPVGPEYQGAAAATRARLSEARDAVAAFSDAGFRDVSLRRLEEPLRYGSPDLLLVAMRGWWDWAWRMETLAPADRHLLTQAVLERVRRRFGDGPIELPEVIHVLTARR